MNLFGVYDMRILVVTSRVKTYALGYQNFIEPLLELGHEIVWAADFSGFVTDRSVIPCVTEQIAINSNPLKPTNIKAFKQICSIINNYNIQAIQCSTPIGSALGRIAGKKMGVTPVIYTAHGFLFFKGAPLINRTIFYWEEKWLARYTDVLITIIDEDYEASQTLKLRSGRKPYMIHGAGINTGTRVDVDRVAKRASIGIPESAFLIVSAGDLNKNKNTEVMVRALERVNDPSVHYIAGGVGPEKQKLEKLANSLGVNNQFHLLGYRTDMAELMAASDAFVIMSFREGLPRSLMEAMDLGLPCIGSNTRGVRDLIDMDGGYICNPRNPDDYASAINDLRHRDLRKMGEHNSELVKCFSADIVRQELCNIYKQVLKD